jgi:hypothetical protein
MVDGEKTPFWAAGGVVSLRRLGKVKCVTHSVTLAHPGLSFRRELYLLTRTIEEKEEEEEEE